MYSKLEYTFPFFPFHYKKVFISSQNDKVASINFLSEATLGMNILSLKITVRVAFTEPLFTGMYGGEGKNVNMKMMR